MPLHRRHAALAAGAVASVGLRWLAGRLDRVEVEGLSMAPELLPGDRLLVARPARLRPGALVVLADPRRPERALVKRVAAGPGGQVLVGGRLLRAARDEVVVLGDNAAASTDSRTFGALPRTAVQGRPIYRYAPADRAGPL